MRKNPKPPLININFCVYLVLCLIFIDLFVYAGFYLHYAYQMITYPYDFDVGEGLTLHRAIALSQGHNIYLSIHQEPFIVSNYPPLFDFLLAGLVKMFGPTLLGGRFLSFSATVFSAFFIYLIVFLESGKRFVSLIAGLLFLTSGWLQSWSVLGRMDMFAIALTLAGLSLFLEGDKKNKGIYVILSALCFVAALFTRQSAVAAPLSCFVYLLLRHIIPEFCLKDGQNVIQENSFKTALKFLLLLVGAGLIPLIILIIMTGGEFWLHVVTYTTGYFSWQEYAKWIHLYLQTHGIVTMISIIFIIISLLFKRISVICLFWIFAFIITITSGKVGSAINYFLEFWAASCILIGVSLSVVLKELYSKSWKIGLWKIFVMTCLFVQLCVFLKYKDYQTPTKKYRIAGETITKYIRQAPGDVLSEYTGYMAQNGKRIVFQPFAMTQLAKRGLWDQKRIVNDIKNNRFSLIIMSRVGLETGRWTKEMNETILQNYNLMETARCFELSYFHHTTSELDIFIPKNWVMHHEGN